MRVLACVNFDQLVNGLERELKPQETAPPANPIHSRLLAAAVLAQ